VTPKNSKKNFGHRPWTSRKNIFSEEEARKLVIFGDSIPDNIYFFFPDVFGNLSAHTGVSSPDFFSGMRDGTREFVPYFRGGSGVARPDFFPALFRYTRDGTRESFADFFGDTRASFPDFFCGTCDGTRVVFPAVRGTPHVFSAYFLCPRLPCVL
jgi:hypothetical protein